MDPVTHSLTGAALARSGLHRTTPLATATLVVAANAPDVDVVTFAAGPYLPLALRRGLTHGPIGLLVLPFAVAGAMLLWARVVRRRRRPDAPSVRPGMLVGLAVVGVATHPLLDWLNTYGIRLLSPLSDRWFYGDALFIVDPWVWIVLGVAVGAGRFLKTRGEVVARGALAVVALYTFAMTAASAAAERDVARTLREAGDPPRTVMYAPRPANPLAGRVVVELAGAYREGRYGWLARPRLRLAPTLVPKVQGMDEGGEESGADPMEAVLRSAEARAYLTWARFPTFRVDEAPGGGRIVHVGDFRYADRPGAGTLAGLQVELDAAGDVRGRTPSH